MQRQLMSAEEDRETMNKKKAAAEVNHSFYKNRFIQSNRGKSDRSLSMSNEIDSGMTSRSKSLVDNPALQMAYAVNSDGKSEPAWVEIEAFILDISENEIQLITMIPSDPRQTHYEVTTAEEYTKLLNVRGGFSANEVSLLFNGEGGYNVDINVMDETKGHVRHAIDTVVSSNSMQMSQCTVDRAQKVRGVRKRDTRISKGRHGVCGHFRQGHHTTSCGIH